MNKGQFIEKMVEKSELTVKDAEKAYKAFTETVIEALKNGEKVQLVGFGTFDIGEAEIPRPASPLQSLPPSRPSSKQARLSRMRSTADSLQSFEIICPLPLWQRALSKVKRQRREEAGTICGWTNI